MLTAKICCTSVCAQCVTDEQIGLHHNDLLLARFTRNQGV